MTKAAHVQRLQGMADEIKAMMGALGAAKKGDNDNFEGGQAEEEEEEQLYVNIGSILNKGKNLIPCYVRRSVEIYILKYIKTKIKTNIHICNLHITLVNSSSVENSLRYCPGGCCKKSYVSKRSLKCYIYRRMLHFQYSGNVTFSIKVRFFATFRIVTFFATGSW